MHERFQEHDDVYGTELSKELKNRKFSNEIMRKTVKDSKYILTRKNIFRNKYDDA